MLEVPDDELETTCRVVKEVMENIVSLSVPLVTEAKCGVNWGNLESMQQSD
jgi:DNA polymerase-1